MTDEQILQYLKDAHIHKLAYLGRDPSKYSTALSLAANRIETLEKERDAMLRVVTDNHVALQRAEAAEAKLEKAVMCARQLVTVLEAKP